MSYNKTLIGGLFWVLLLNLLVKPFWILGIEVPVQNAVGTEAYGIYFTLFNIAYIFNILLDIGITNYNTRNIAQYPVLITRYIPAILALKGVLLAFYLVATLTVGLLMGYRSQQFGLLALLSFNQFLNSLILYLRSNFQGLLLLRWDSVLSVLDRLLMILICAALLWLPMGQGAFRIEWFVMAQTVAYLCVVVVCLTLLWRRTHFAFPRFRPLFSWAILKQSAPFALLVLLMATYNRIDPLMLNLLSPAGEGSVAAGEYAASFRLLDAMTMICYLVSVPLLPIYSRLTHERADVAQTTRTVAAPLFAAVITAAVTLSVLAEPVMSLLYPATTVPQTQCFSVLVFGIVPIALTYVYGTLLTAGGRLRLLNTFALCTLVLNILLNRLLIPRIGVVGSAFASLGAQTFMALAQLVAASRAYNIGFSARYISKVALFSLFIIGINFLLLRIGIVWYVQLCVLGVAAAVLAVVLRLLDIGQLRVILAERKES